MKKFGNDYRLWVESAVPGTFHELKGQTDLELDETSSPVDTSTKDNFPYSTSAGGMRGLTMTVNCIPDLPDVNGYTRLETVAKAPTPTSIKLQVRKGGAGGSAPADVVHECEWHVTGRPRSFPMGGAVVNTRFAFANSGSPSIDALA